MFTVISVITFPELSKVKGLWTKIPFSNIRFCSQNLGYIMPIGIPSCVCVLYISSSYR